MIEVLFITWKLALSVHLDDPVNLSGKSHSTVDSSNGFASTEHRNSAVSVSLRVMLSLR